jgi:hypothetical protein
VALDSAGMAHEVPADILRRGKDTAKEEFESDALST